jgi:LPXTG-motif cell wall-anchored protein
MAPMLLTSIAVPAGRSDAAEEKVSATTVAEGLKTIQRAGEAVVAAGADKAKAEQAAAAVEPVWAMIEDTVRANDENSYTAFEGRLEDLEAAAKAGDAKKAGGAAGAISSVVTSYVAKFPAGAPTRSAAAAPGPARSADAAPAATEAGDATLARTGPASSALAALAGAAFGLGGLAVIGGARRRRSSPIA